jgi:uncharacterized membrane protein YkvI
MDRLKAEAFGLFFSLSAYSGRKYKGGFALKEKISIIRVMKYAGAYIAFEIGSGFATGQEILQFYTSYGTMGIAGAIVSMILFSWAGGSLMKIGHRVGEKAAEKPYQLFCGKILGTFYEYFVLFYLFAVLAVMISGAGASLSEYCGVSYYVGGLIMALLVFGAFAFGLDKLIDIVGLMGPLIIGFSVFIAICTITANFGDLMAGNVDVEFLQNARPAQNWWFSGILYVAYNTVSSVAFLMALGRDAKSEREAAAGGIAGGVLLMITVIFMNLALTSRLDLAESSIVPSLKLAENVSSAAGTVFVCIMICGIFSTAAPVLWSICNGLARPKSKASLIIAFLVSADSFILGQLPFDKLVAFIYPFTGYLGIILLFCVFRWQIGHRKNTVQRN